MFSVGCFPSSPCSAEVPVEFSVPWTEQASEHCWDTSPVEEPPSRQLGQVLSFRTRQLHVLIHLFCCAVPSHVFLPGWLFVVCWLQLPLPQLPGVLQQPCRVGCTLPAVLWSSGAEKQHLALSPGHSLLGRLVLSTQTSAMWAMGELPGAGPGAGW